MGHPDQQLADLESAGLLRGLRTLESGAGTKVIRDGRAFHNFASNDYLGLASHPGIQEALVEGVAKFGAGSSASRLVCGSLPPHQHLEEELAAAKGTEAALTLSSGFAAAMGTIPAVVGKGDYIVLDKLAHACLVDASRLSDATLRVFPHNDLGKLERLLVSIRSKDSQAGILIVTESVFSMDGDLCPLAEIVTLAEAHGAMTLLDEAHGFGVLGDTGMGLAEQEGLTGRITFQMGTLSKAAGLSGGMIAAPRAWIDLLINRARSFIYSTAPPPCIVSAACEALRIIRSEEGAELRNRLNAHIQNIGATDTPIHPVILGSNEAALSAAKALEGAGFLVPAIRYPTVPRGKARLRVSLSAAHKDDQVRALGKAMEWLSPEGHVE